MEVAAEEAARMPDEMALLNEARQGSVDAFSKLVDMYKRPAYFAALGLVRNHDDALELSQEAFARAFIRSETAVLSVAVQDS